MKNKSLIPSSFYLKIIFVASLLVLVFITAITYRHTQSLTESIGWVMDTYKKNIQVEQLYSSLKDAETGQRGYIITHDSLFLEPYHLARQQVDHAFIQLEKLTENKQQEEQLQNLYRLINARFDQLAMTLSVTRDQPLRDDLLKSSMITGKSIMDSIRLQVSMMAALETSYLRERQAKYEYKTSITPLFSLLFLLFALNVFIFSYWKINHDLKTLKRKNQQLMLQSESISHAEEIGAFSCWHWNLETNKLVYSDNQYRLLGCEPQSFEATIEKFLEFVHPDDQQTFTNAITQAIETQTYPEVVFRIKRKDGVTRHFKSLSKLVPDRFGSDLFIGINMDITEQHLNNIALKERNHELEQKNKELASFNHVASHDLQEPLRIVQTYISRLTEEEIGLMSAKGKDYIVRIKLAVTRMRKLIDALLLFSRTNRTDSVFEMTDLNQLLDNARQDLSPSLEQKKGSIISTQLPTLNVIPFQIQQLFTNLIGNSIKYSKPEVPLLIQIKCEKPAPLDFPITPYDHTRNYYKIVVEDNGIGFEQDYAEHIFTLFQRLHHDEEYEGTGIGLSICKKIAENHGGFITAQGNPGIGSTFFIYLPV
jgi:signal transduction histidine kinase/CHASE3 domain sensor protein